MISPPPPSPYRPARMFGAVPLSLRHVLLLIVLLPLLPLPSESKCRRVCDTALASYYITPGLPLNLTYIASLFGYTLGRIDTEILPYNPNITTKDSIQENTRVNVPFACGCIDGSYLGTTFPYKVHPGDTYAKIAGDVYANLTTFAWLAAVNPLVPQQNIPDTATISVTINCSCGGAQVSEDYGLFATYPLRPGQTLDSVAREVGLPDAGLLQRYNPGLNFSSGSGIAFVPAKGRNGTFPRLIISKGGISGGAIAGISVAAVVVLISGAGLCIILRRRQAKKGRLLSSAEYTSSAQLHESEVTPYRQAETSQFTGITVDKAVEFSYEELAKATNNFSMEAKIGQGGFGAVYYAELRGEKTAVKKMDLKASKEFFAELKVLSQVHHLNLVRLIGYCTEDALFLVYEYIENGNLSQHLRGSGKKDPLPWSTRERIALDSARALEYIHEHTVPVYVHRDIKSANILIDKNKRAKVADFGLARLTEVDSSSQTKVVGTFGYMPPEYAQYGEVSPKVDVYAFGVVLYELISAQEAIVRTNALVTESKGLVQLFEEVLRNSGQKENLRKMVDPRLGDDYSIEAVYKVAQLAKACTQESAQQRPTMRSIVVALMTLSSATEDWDVRQFYEDNAMAGLMSGR